MVVSGSNALQGISCKQIQKELEVDCFNGATTYALGVEYYLYNDRKWIRPNDIVLLPLEYEAYVYDGEINNALVDYTMSRDPTISQLSDGKGLLSYWVVPVS